MQGSAITYAIRFLLEDDSARPDLLGPSRTGLHRGAQRLSRDRGRTGYDEADRHEHALREMTGNMTADDERAGRRDGPQDVAPFAGSDDGPKTLDARLDAYGRGWARRSAGGRSFSRLPRSLDRLAPDDRLVNVDAAVHHMEEHGFAGHEVDDRRIEAIVAGDDVHVSGSRGRARADRRRP